MSECHRIFDILSPSLAYLLEEGTRMLKETTKKIEMQSEERRKKLIGNLFKTRTFI